MIEQPVLLWAGTVALLSTFGGLAVSVPRYRENEASFMGLIAYTFGLMFWLLYTINAFNYHVVADNGELLARGDVGLALVGAVGSVLAVVLLLDGAMRTLGINT